MACENIFNGNFKPVATVGSSKQNQDDDLERAIKASMLP